MTRLLTGMALAAGLALSAAPGVANITIVGGDAGEIPAGSTHPNDFLTASLAGSFGLSYPTLGGFFNAQLTGSAPAYRFEYFGAEAGATNTFTVGSKSFVHDPGSTNTLSASVLDTIIASTLDFTIGTTQSGAAPNPVVNNDDGTGNNDGGDDPLTTDVETNFTNFFVTFGDDSTKSGDVVWVFFDDSGASDDDNHDDMVVRISAVPLPAGVLLLGLGLGGLAAYRRRQAA